MHWKNSQFQVRNFIANKCHTPDEAYRLLKQLEEERRTALQHEQASRLRIKAKSEVASNVLQGNGASVAEKLEAEADLLEIESNKKVGTALVAEANRELEYIATLIEELQPHRKYADLPDHEAFQRIQEEEWGLELLWRAENFVVAQGFIPPEHVAVMRLHPNWGNGLGCKVSELLAGAKAGTVSLPSRTSVLTCMASEVPD